MQNLKRSIHISFVLLLIAFVPRLLWDYFALPYKFIAWVGALIFTLCYVRSLRKSVRQIRFSKHQKAIRPSALSPDDKRDRHPEN